MKKENISWCRKTSIMIRAFLICTAAVMMMSFSSVKVHAQEISEVEPNDTSDQAQLIFANSETAAGCVNGSYTGQRVINGTISSSDTDWYRVSLSAGTNYVTSNGASYYFDIYLESDLANPVASGLYTNVGLGITAYEFTLSSSGTYYVKLVGVSSSAAAYKFLIGSPTYSVADYTYSFGSISMNGSNVTRTFNLTYDASIPADAIVYSLSISNLSSSYNNGVTVQNLSSGTSYALSSTNLTTNISVYSNVPLKASWKYTFKYKKTGTISPRTTFYYVYPVTSNLVD